MSSSTTQNGLLNRSQGSITKRYRVVCQEYSSKFDSDIEANVSSVRDDMAYQLRSWEIELRWMAHSSVL